MFPSVELEIAPDTPSPASRSTLPAAYQLVLSMTDGVWEGKTKTLASHKTATASAEAWQAELAFNWKRLGLDPHRTAALRVNLQRNLRIRLVPGVNAWYATFRPDKLEPLTTSRGWLVLEP